MSEYWAFQRYIESIKKYPLLTQNEEVELALEMRSPDPKKAQRAKDKFINCNLRLVLQISQKYAGGLPLADCFQEGVFGLIRAVEKFDPKRGYKFSTYAYNWIKQAVVRAKENKQSTVRLTVAVHADIKKLRKCASNFNNLTIEKLAQELNWTKEKVKKTLQYAETARNFSLNMEIGSELEFLDLVTSPSQTDEELELLNWALGELDELQQKVLELRCIQQLNCKQVGEILGISDRKIPALQKEAEIELYKKCA